MRHKGDTGDPIQFPNVSGQFGVIHKTVMIDVSEGGKTGARPVTVTTVGSTTQRIRADLNIEVRIYTHAALWSLSEMLLSKACH
jgi:hypothetical protein